MAVYTGSKLIPITAGDLRKSKRISGLTAGTVPAGNRNDRIDGYHPFPLVGQYRFQPRRIYKDTTLQATTVVTITEHDGERNYRFIHQEGLGDRVRGLGEDRMLLGEIPMFVQEQRILTGSSTFGIGHAPTIIEKDSSKQIRRWPREWHGENMN